MPTRALLSPNPSINQQVIEQCRRICASKTFNKAEEARQKKGESIRITKDEVSRLKNSEGNRRFLIVLVNAWVKGEELNDLEVRKRLSMTNMDPQDSSMRKRSKQVRLALRNYYLGTQYEEAEGNADSIEIAIDRGFNIDVFLRRDVYHQVSDVLATFPHVPASDITARIDSPACAHIRVCLTGFVELIRWKPRLIAALKRAVTMDFVFSHPKSAFVEQRAISLSHQKNDLLEERPDDIKSILADNRKTIKEIVSTAAAEIEAEQQSDTKLGTVTLKWTTGWIPLPYAQIDDAIYVGAFWRESAIGDGPFFLLDAFSPTGKFLSEQFGKVWNTAMLDNLSEADIPAMTKPSLPAVLGTPE